MAGRTPCKFCPVHCISIPSPKTGQLEPAHVRVPPGGGGSKKNRTQARYPKKRFPAPGPAARPPRPAQDSNSKTTTMTLLERRVHFFASSCVCKAFVSYVHLLSDPSSRMPGQVNSISNYHVVVIAEMFLSAICSEKIKRFHLGHARLVR